LSKPSPPAAPSDRTLTEPFWGDLFGQLEDPFGHRWIVSEHLRDDPHEEVVAAAAKLFS
jgi:PhnB protein